MAIIGGGGITIQCKNTQSDVAYFYSSSYMIMRVMGGIHSMREGEKKDSYEEKIRWTRNRRWRPGHIDGSITLKWITTNRV
jgi:hypothetical protein